MSEDTPKLIQVPHAFSLDPETIAKARAFGEARGSFIDKAISDMREREEELASEGAALDPRGLFEHPTPDVGRTVFEQAMAVMEACAGGVSIGGNEHMIKLPGDGEPAYLVTKEPDPIRIGLSMKWDFPKTDPIDFVTGRQLGGHHRPDPHRFITITRTDLPVPRAPGVDEMREDGWVWTGWHFARYRAGRYAVHMSDRRVLAGRYADRLPTNRKRKRERCKERRRERLA